MKFALLAASMLLATAGCAVGGSGQAAYSQNSGLQTTNAVDPNATKAEIAKYLVIELSRAYGAGDFGSIGVKSPQRFDLSDVGREFSQFAGIKYSADKADILIDFRLEEVEGILSGPSIKNYQLTGILLRNDKLRGGDEIIGIRAERFWCSTTSEGGRDLCKNKVPVRASNILYGFCCSPLEPATRRPITIWIP